MKNPQKGGGQHPFNGMEQALKKKVLLVDDEPNIITSLEYLMQKAGFEVQIARDGSQALEALKQPPPDLMLLDVMMPEFDGYKVCEEIRKNDRWRDTKIIMLTASGRENERQMGLKAGADAYITKPFSTRDLVVKVKELLAD